MRLVVSHMPLIRYADYRKIISIPKPGAEGRISTKMVQSSIERCEKSKQGVVSLHYLIFRGMTPLFLFFNLFCQIYYCVLYYALMTFSFSEVSDKPKIPNQPIQRFGDKAVRA
jgi:hypothetical protein